jgi:drug/metabolite transporter (DMT)-like permease
MVIVGSSVVASKMIATSWPVYLASMIRFGMSLPILIVLNWKNLHRFKTLSGRDWLILFIQSLTGAFLFNVLLLYGLRLTSAVESGIITSTTPAIIMILSWLFLRECPTWNEGVGVALAFAGILVLNLIGVEASGGPFSPASLLGNLLVLGAAIGEALFTFLGKITGDRIAPLEISLVLTVFAFLLSLPMGIVEALRFDFSGVPLIQYIPLAYYAVFVTVIAYMLWFSAVPKVSASTSAVFTSLLPISAVLLSYLILGERFVWAHLIGGAFVLASIWVVTFQRKPKSPQVTTS